MYPGELPSEEIKRLTGLIREGIEYLVSINCVVRKYVSNIALLNWEGVKGVSSLLQSPFSNKNKGSNFVCFSMWIHF